MSRTSEILQLVVSGTNSLSAIAQRLNRVHKLRGNLALKDSDVRIDAKNAKCTEFAGGKVNLKRAGKVNCGGCVFSGGDSCPVPLDIINASRRGNIDTTKGSDEFRPGRIYRPGEASAVSGKSAKYLK